ncbi:MAG: class I adenylate-forming enzyme family protein, partial [Myxococcota bacterium]
MEDLQKAWQQLTAPGAPFAWSLRDVAGRPMRTYDTAAPSLRTIWELSRAHGDKDYLIYADERITYAEAHDKVARIAAYLASRGVERGDRVAIAMRNYPEWALTYWATISLGATSVGMNAWWTGRELEYGLVDSAPKVLVCDIERLRTVAPHLDAIRKQADLEIVVVRAPGEVPADAVAWEEVEATAADGLPAVDIGPDDDVCIFYTSGTTDTPKGAVMTHRGVVTNLLNLAFGVTVMVVARQNQNASEAPAGAPPAPLTALLAVPLFHVTGCNCCLHPVTAQGGRLILMHKWNAGEALETIERERVTLFTGVPMMSRELLEHPDFEQRDTSTLGSLGGGGAAVQPDLVDKIESKLEKGRAGTGYGLTETCGVVSMNSVDFFLSKPKTVGPALPVVEAKIVDDQGNEVDSGTVGELLVYGPQNVRGYLNKPEATEEA